MTEDPDEKIGTDDPWVAKVTLAACCIFLVVIVGCLVVRSLPALVWPMTCVAALLASHALVFFAGYFQRYREERKPR